MTEQEKQDKLPQAIAKVVVATFLTGMIIPAFIIGIDSSFLFFCFIIALIFSVIGVYVGISDIYSIGLTIPED